MKRTIAMAVAALLVTMVAQGALRTVTSGTLAHIATNRPYYIPGEEVKFTIDTVAPGSLVRYRHGAQVLAQHPLSSAEWTWTPPATDYRGYMVDVYRLDGDRETIIATIGVDVSSNWKRFPRYGFVATFDRSKLAPGVIEGEMAFLNRCHINGVQFQDWHYKHHWPLNGTPGNLLPEFTDIANRTNSMEVIKKYIDVQHSLGMKSIFYNLCFGVLDDGEADGVKPEWGVFKDRNHSKWDHHPLPKPAWKSSIFLVDPGLPEWHKYMAQRNDEVYASYDFDGYQVDQLGPRGDTYDWKGKPLDLASRYPSFLAAMKKAHPNKGLIMNSVSRFGAKGIAGTGAVEFCYNEMWGPGDGSGEDSFATLLDVIKDNDKASGNTLATVFACYVNHDKRRGWVNTPAALMCDAVMFALGSSHLELGPHMLTSEYFPSAKLAMSPQLKDAMVCYYDFLVAYENLLQGTASDSEVKVKASSPAVAINAWPPVQGGVTTYSRKVDGKLVMNLLNFVNIDNLSWRDMMGVRMEPLKLTDTPVAVTVPGKVSRVWVASPDIHGGVPVDLHFEQQGDKLSFVVPLLNYWTMVVIE